MNIVICEDEKKDSDSLRLFIEAYYKDLNCNVQISVYGSGDEFINDFETQKIKDVKLVFLDIFMPGTDGIDVAKKIREYDNDMVIVFTTTSKSHGLEGFSVYALQYLVKPVNYPEVKDVLDKCTEKFVDSLRFIEVLSDRLTVKIYLKDIMYIESYDTVLHIHTVAEIIKTFLPLSEIEKQLDEKTFLRTQRSYIVNMRYINDMTADDFILENGTAIPIRRSEKQAIKQVYRDYLSELTWKM
jgi:DNA-binding LytR/AlgR family response regulator